MPLIIPGDATYPAFYQTLARQHGRGYIHESEGSVITNIWRSSTNSSKAQRKSRFLPSNPLTRKPSSSPSFPMSSNPKPSSLKHNPKEYPVLLFFVGMTNGKITALYKKLSMECIKKLHETVEILEILWAKCLNCLKNLMQIFRMFITAGLYPATPKRLYIHYILFNYSLIINSTNYGSLYSNYRFGRIHRCIK